MMEDLHKMNNKMNIPLVDLKTNYLTIKDEIDNVIQEVIDKIRDITEGEVEGGNERFK